MVLQDVEDLVMVYSSTERMLDQRLVFTTTHSSFTSSKSFSIIAFFNLQVFFDLPRAFTFDSPFLGHGFIIGPFGSFERVHDPSEVSLGVKTYAFPSC